MDTEQQLIGHKISIVTPSYNQGQFIERTILSVINQNYPNLEYIVIDGGSTDNTVDIIKKYEDKITYWVSEKDEGQTDAINKGMQKATGDIICWINSDDVLLPRSLSFIDNYFRENKDVELVNGSVIEINKDDKCLKIIYGIFSKWFAQRGCYNILQPSMVWRYSIMEKIGYLSKDYHACMDLEFLIRAYENNIVIRQVDKTIGAIRVYENTKTALGGDIWINDYKKIEEKYNGRYIKNNHSFNYLLYIICKMLNGYYLKMLLFIIKYKGKDILNARNQ